MWFCTSLLLKHVNSFTVTINSISETSCKLHSFALLFGFMMLMCASQRACCLRRKKSTDLWTCQVHHSELRSVREDGRGIGSSSLLYVVKGVSTNVCVFV